MNEQLSKEETRWLVVKAMIDEFPKLRKKSQKLPLSIKKTI